MTELLPDVYRPVLPPAVTLADYAERTPIDPSTDPHEVYLDVVTCGTVARHLMAEADPYSGGDPQAILATIPAAYSTMMRKYLGIAQADAPKFAAAAAKIYSRSWEIDARANGGNTENLATSLLKERLLRARRDRLTTADEKYAAVASLETFASAWISAPDPYDRPVQHRLAELIPEYCKAIRNILGLHSQDGRKKRESITILRQAAIRATEYLDSH